MRRSTILCRPAASGCTSWRPRWRPRRSPPPSTARWCAAPGCWMWVTAWWAAWQLCTACPAALHMLKRCHCVILFAGGRDWQVDRLGAVDVAAAAGAGRPRQPRWILLPPRRQVRPAGRWLVADASRAQACSGQWLLQFELAWVNSHAILSSARRSSHPCTHTQCAYHPLPQPCRLSFGGGGSGLVSPLADASNQLRASLGSLPHSAGPRPKATPGTAPPSLSPSKRLQVASPAGRTPVASPTKLR